MESGGGRSAEERRAAAEARARAREGRLETGDEDLLAPGAEPERAPDDLRTHYGGPDVYGQRRLVAGLIVIGIVVVLFLLLGGC